jgi:hypothetical protein
MYHVLLIGIDAYPKGYNSLAGCVSDIDAVESLLLDPPGIGFPADQICVKRLAAPQPGRPSASRLEAQTLPPTKANVVAALKALAGPEVKEDDRVLVYYSGHGQETLWQGSLVWHEALVPNDGQKVEYLFDVEVNGLIEAIAARTSDLTVVLDSCHSAGATRDLEGVESEGLDRSLGGEPELLEPPDLSALGLAGGGPAAGDRPARLLQGVDPNYLVVVACQPQERAGEGQWPGEARAQGVFSFGLVNRLRAVPDAPQRAELRWADLWPDLLDRVAARSTQLRRRPQHPWIIGRSERRIFGGPWVKGDVGYRVTRLADGRYRIGAGTLMGLTPGAEVAVYGKDPADLAPLGSAEDRPAGRLRVVTAERAECTAEALSPFDLPLGARGRLVKPGTAELLRVALKPADAAVAAELALSPLLKIVPADSPDADVEVVGRPGGGWTIGNDTEPALARVPAGETFALRAGLESYYRVQAARSLARSCSDPQLSGSLDLHVLDCSDRAALDAMTPEQRSDPVLPELPKAGDRVYTAARGTRACFRLTNSSRHDLQVTVLNCSAGGLVEYLGDAVLRAGARHILWLRGEVGRGFPLSADPLPEPEFGHEPRPFATDRVLAIGTTRLDADLHPLQVRKTVQMVVDENLSTRGERGMLDEEEKDAAPSELWTAREVSIRIEK